MTAGVASRNGSVGLRLGAGLDRRALAVVMPIGPLAVAVVPGILPTARPTPTLSWPAKVAAHQGVESAVLGRPASQVSTTPPCARLRSSGGQS